jgi:hypothetical protein
MMLLLKKGAVFYRQEENIGKLGGFVTSVRHENNVGEFVRRTIESWKSGFSDLSRVVRGSSPFLGWLPRPAGRPDLID